MLNSIVAFPEITRMQNNGNYAVRGHSRQYFHYLLRSVCDLLLANDTALHPISHCFRAITRVLIKFLLSMGLVELSSTRLFSVKHYI